MKNKLIELWLWTVAVAVTLIMVATTFMWFGALVLFAKKFFE